MPLAMGGHKSQPREGKKNVQFWVPADLVEQYREAAKQRERSVAQALRLHMAETVREDERERQAA